MHVVGSRLALFALAYGCGLPVWHDFDVLVMCLVWLPLVCSVIGLCQLLGVQGGMGGCDNGVSVWGRCDGVRKATVVLSNGCAKCVGWFVQSF